MVNEETRLKKLSVVIPCRNAANTIANQLEALAAQTWSEPWEIVVSDNGSSDDSLSVINGFQDRILSLRVVDSSDRIGRGHARNVGARAAVGEALAFCDADDEVAPGWVAAMGEALSKHDFVACRWDIEKLNEPRLQKIRGGNPQRNGLQVIWYPPYLLHAGGGGMGIKRSLHAAVGGFDESLPRLQDTDYCFKVQLAGVKLHFVSDAVLYVRFRDTLGSFFNQSRHWGQYNVFLYKRYRPPNMRIPHPWRRYLSDWKRLLSVLSRLYHREGCFSFARLFGWQIGQLYGCIRYLSSPTAYPRKVPSQYTNEVQ